MTILWIFAVVWPIAVFVFIDMKLLRELREMDGALIDAIGKLHFEHSQSPTDIKSLKKTVVEQDELIAALWAQAYGYSPSEAEHFIHSWDNYPSSAYGVSPKWVLRAHVDDTESFSTLHRSLNYPWL
ncbi:MAG: hypothetical protein KUG69_09920 [Marinosulfonomonas sp.]|nr:hypothetical protein [Marinosulfonomonas sp.]